MRVEPNRPASCTRDVRQHALAHVPFFEQLSPDDLASIDRRCRVEDYDAGQAIHHMGQPARFLHVVASGTGKVVRPAMDGTEVLLDVVRPGDFVGALPALESDTYGDSAWAITPMCVLTLGTETFEEILDEHPSVARAGLRVMAERLERAGRRVHAMAAADSAQRIAGALAMLAERMAVPRDGGLLIDLPLSREDLAGLAGTTSETASRVVSRLQREGVLRTGRQWIEVADLEALQRLATV